MLILRFLTGRSAFGLTESLIAIAIFGRYRQPLLPDFHLISPFFNEFVFCFYQLPAESAVLITRFVERFCKFIETRQA